VLIIECRNYFLKRCFLERKFKQSPANFRGVSLAPRFLFQDIANFDILVRHGTEYHMIPIGIIFINWYRQQKSTAIFFTRCAIRNTPNAYTSIAATLCPDLHLPPDFGLGHNTANKFCNCSIGEHLNRHIDIPYVERS